MTRSAGRSIHAVAFQIGEAGLLVTGGSGAGKSTFVLAVGALWSADPVRLVADDRVTLHAAGRRLVARPVAGFLGRIEVRGMGMADLPAMPSTVVRGIVALGSDEPERLPEEPFESIGIEGVFLPALRIRQGAFAAADFVAKWPYFRDRVMPS